MTTDQTQPTAQALPNPRTEKRFAVAEIAAPAACAAIMPLLDPQAAGTMATFLAAPALVAGLTFTGVLSDQLLDSVPGGDLLRAHRRPFFVSAVATATAAATATVHGLAGIDGLAFGFLSMPSVAGLVSCAWWSASGFVAYSLRKVLGVGRHRPRPTVPVAAAPGQGSGPMDPQVLEVLRLWHDHVSGDGGTHPGQHLTLTAHGSSAWEGIVEAAPGRPVTVTAETVSGVYRLPVDWVHFTDGPHTSSRHIRVDLVAPTAEQPQYSALEARWLRKVAHKSGCMPGTHLEGAVEDPATGGVAAWIVADDDTDAITVPDQYRIAGALHTTTLLVSVTPTTNPRKAILRLMEHSPLEDGKPLPGPEVLLANKNGFVQLGTGISGRPSRLQLFDPKIGAQHVLVAGVTGSGKGGVLQLICLAYHVNSVAIIYADPKGSSNPDAAKMAAYAGCGKEQAMGSLRVAYAILLHRIAESAAADAKNFTASAERPFVALVLDEFAQLLGEKSPFMKEAAFIVAAIAEQGRSLGMAVVLCGQILNLEKMGSDTSIRDNVFYGGALVLLRSDGAQKHRVDLPDAFAGADPSRIPAFWKGDDDTLIYDPTVPEDDPSRTFGVGYVVGPDERAEMMRAWILESAAGLYDPERIVIPADFPDWDNREDIAATPVGPAATTTTSGGDGDDWDGGSGGWTPRAATAQPQRELTAEEKIVRVLDERRDPIGEEVGYLHLDQIEEISGVNRKTLENTCSRLAKGGTLVRNPDRAGEYGLPLPKQDRSSVPA
ncbi:type IV secretory system conjugative DNA transfer family protein [Kitasatospora sp. RB6PN24]|uniref:type IV secretory system conjugative DNA transfer family protein n=1 Tax=Kitasatospora humi TaxID=2893891 RepID=UPI001E53892D|nr:type IV secretory system conjugative DNA transfer family protein [Kitasatospora humi]MCC9312077.1 type IV secretory system conjugative DNA transfer family protein [Kitasatospora humi]